jgi:hypothetical protein
MTQRTAIILSFLLFVFGLLWGGYTLIVYLGIPVHELVYSTQDDVRTLDIACGADSSISTYLCRGSASLVPFVQAIFRMGSPFTVYVLLSLALYAALLLWNGYNTGEFRFRVTVRPIALIGCFVLSVWLLATTFSVGTLYNAATPVEQMIQNADGQRILPPFTRFYEPVPQVYTGVGPQGLAALRANYESLLARGCLDEVGTTQNGAKIYDLGFLCMQASLFARAGTQLLFIFLFLINLLVVGRFALRRFVTLSEVHPLLRLTFSFGLGALFYVALLWTLGIFNLLHSSLVLILFFGIPILLFREMKAWLDASLYETFELEGGFDRFLPILAWLLVTYLALNFLNVVRPFPIGWDDLGSYLNRPRLLASYGGFISSMSQFQWEYLTSLGFLIFGYDSWYGSTFAMQINWAAGLLAVLSIYSFARVYLGKGKGLVATMLYYFLPMTGHFSFADMKIDNASFFVSVLAVLATLAALTEADDGTRPSPSRRTLLVAGLLGGFAFAIKPTAVLSILLILSIRRYDHCRIWHPPVLRRPQHHRCCPSFTPLHSCQSIDFCHAAPCSWWRHDRCFLASSALCDSSCPHQSLSSCFGLGNLDPSVGAA